MSENAAADQIEKEFEAVHETVQAALLGAVLFTWGGLVTRVDDFDVFGLKIPRDQAFHVAAAVYLLVNLRLWLTFRRLRDIIVHAEAAEVESWSRALASQPWVLNPFGDYRRKGAPAWYSRLGLALLVLAWWFCNISLFLLPRDLSWTQIGLSFVFLFLGFVTVAEIRRVFGVAWRTAKAAGSPWGQRWQDVGNAIVVPAFCAVFVGVTGYSLVLHQRKSAPPAAKREVAAPAAATASRPAESTAAGGAKQAPDPK